ncbi:hypothetical protein J6590_040892 [Homalodisca vitripennis]|nr:hypothetical protein J6590_040892 [Homalodisca vitripennis]
MACYLNDCSTFSLTDQKAPEVFLNLLNRIARSESLRLLVSSACVLVKNSIDRLFTFIFLKICLWSASPY